MILLSLFGMELTLAISILLLFVQSPHVHNFIPLSWISYEYQKLLVAFCTYGYIFLCFVTRLLWKLPFFLNKNLEKRKS